MNSTNAKYFALAMELPAFMLAMGYGAQWLDESYGIMGGYGLLIGIMLSLVFWVGHASILLMRANRE